MKKLLVIAMAAALSGCVQLIRFTDGSAYYCYRGTRSVRHPYKATKEVFSGWFLAPARTYNWWGLGTSDPIGSAWLTLAWPGSLVDLPCEAVCDTVMLVPDLILMEGTPNEKHQ